MMKDHLFFLDHILDSIDLIFDYTKGYDLGGFPGEQTGPGFGRSPD